jgi:hypothetical protein
MDWVITFRCPWHWRWWAGEKIIIWSKQTINNRKRGRLSNYLYSSIVKSSGADRIEETERIDNSGNFVVQYVVRNIERKMVFDCLQWFYDDLPECMEPCFQILQIEFWAVLKTLALLMANSCWGKEVEQDNDEIKTEGTWLPDGIGGIGSDVLWRISNGQIASREMWSWYQRGGHTKLESMW